MLISALLIALLPSQAAHAAGSCSFEALCAAYSGGYRNPRGERIRPSIPKKALASFDTPTAKARIQGIFDRAKETVSGLILSDFKLSDDTRSSIQARLKEATLVVQASGLSNYSAVFLPDSWNLLADHSVAEMPEADLFFLFAHELTHSFDTGMSLYNLVREDGGLYPNDETTNPGRPEHPHEIVAKPIPAAELAPITDALKSLRLKPSQLDETMCDHVAALALVKHLATLPQKMQRSAAREGQMDLVVSACNETGLIDEDHETYLSMRKRVEVLYFGNADIARIAGCSESY